MAAIIKAIRAGFWGGNVSRTGGRFTKSAQPPGQQGGHLGEALFGGEERRFYGAEHGGLRGRSGRVCHRRAYARRLRFAEVVGGEVGFGVGAQPGLLW
jgi:hypothetical protein